MILFNKNIKIMFKIIEICLKKLINRIYTNENKIYEKSYLYYFDKFIIFTLYITSF